VPRDVPIEGGYAKEGRGWIPNFIWGLRIDGLGFVELSRVGLQSGIRRIIFLIYLIFFVRRRSISIVHYIPR